MRDTIYHNGGHMRARRARVRAVEVGQDQAELSDDALRDLLDHLGHLLAREYVVLLRRAERSEREPGQEKGKK